jgi:hypothetical protein
MSFSHPLARQARVWETAGTAGTVGRVLVVVTTLALDPENKKYKADKVEALRTAVREWLAAHADKASDYMLVNRTKEW